MPIQRNESEHSQPPAATQTTPNKTGLPNNLKSGIESLSGYSMDDVNVFYNSGKPAQLKAHAQAQANNIHVAPGQEKHLAHEAWHVVQQKQGRVKPTIQLKGKNPVAINDDQALEKEADIMGAKAEAIGNSGQVVQQKSLKTGTLSSPDSAPVQGKFGFEIELPIFMHARPNHVPIKVLEKYRQPKQHPYWRMPYLPVDAAYIGGERNIYQANECHVNVDHSKALNPLYQYELHQYITNRNLPSKITESIFAQRGKIWEDGASIVELVTKPWDESALTERQARDKIQSVISFAKTLFDRTAGGQARLGRHYIGSNAPNASMYQPRLGYFHATYGIKLSQIPRLFKETTRHNRKNIARLARRNKPEKEHADNLKYTHESVGKSKNMMSQIKDVWPRQKARVGKGSKGWPRGADKKFLGFITLIANYLPLLKRTTGNSADVSKKSAGMHFYKSDLHDVANQLPSEIMTPLRTNVKLRLEVIDIIARQLGLFPGTPLKGILNGWTIAQYVNQILTGSFHNHNSRDANNKPIKDPALSNGLNMYSPKLGPEEVGPDGNKEMGVILENRHIDYLRANYVNELEENEAKMHQEVGLYGRKDWSKPDDRTDYQKNMELSIGARSTGPEKRPIDEWEDTMMNIYRMVRAINRRRG
ncbi:MAG TPA: hypothetical protein DCS93_19750 [Microscillaceae bacterium]|nr:hypothetical protein [Microscillaceae bacterium]